MKTNSSYKKRSRQISLTGSPSRNKGGLEVPNAHQLLRIEDQVNRSDRVLHGHLIQQKADVFTAQLRKNTGGKKKEPSKHKTGKFIPSKAAEIHIYEYPYGNKKIKGHLTIGHTKYLVNNHQKALKALELLREHREAKGFSEMESMLICWLEALNPSNETAPVDEPIKKKHADGDDEPDEDSSISTST